MVQKELSVHMQVYVPYVGDKTKEQLEDEFNELVLKFFESNNLNYQIYDTKLQEV